MPAEEAGRLLTAARSGDADRVAAFFMGAQAHRWEPLLARYRVREPNLKDKGGGSLFSKTLTHKEDTLLPKPKPKYVWFDPPPPLYKCKLTTDPTRHGARRSVPWRARLTWPVALLLHESASSHPHPHSPLGGGRLVAPLALDMPREDREPSEDRAAAAERDTCHDVPWRGDSDGG